MSEAPATFGARVNGLTPEQALSLEAEEGRRERFADLDAFAEKVLVKALHGEQVLKVSGDVDQSEVALRLRSDADRATLERFFARAAQEREGAWYIPAAETLNLGVVELAYWHPQDPRHLVSITSERRSRVTLDPAGAVAVWALLEPALDALALPLKLRAGRWAGRATKPPAAAKRAALWHEVGNLYANIGLDYQALAAFAPGHWGRPRAAEVVERRARLIASWAVAGPEHVRRLRAAQVSKLVARYYTRAKGGGTARRSAVLNDRACERILSAYFAGDWLAFLDYLGEQPHDDEEVIRALPQPSLLTASSTQASSVAAAHGVDDDELQRILAAYWNQPEATSPLEQRVSALRDFWQEFDAVHARQEPEDRPLFRLLGTGQPNYTFEPAAKRRTGHLSQTLQADISRLWATAVNPRFPERLITEPNPEFAASGALGPAFRFWQEVGVKAY